MKLEDKLEGLAIEHEDIAKSIRVTLSLLNGHNTAKARKGIGGKLSAAVAMRNGNGHDEESDGNGHVKTGHPAKGKGGAYLIARMLKKRGKLTTSELRDALSHAGAPRTTMLAIGAAKRYGYIKFTGRHPNRTFEFLNMPPKPEGM